MNGHAKHQDRAVRLTPSSFDPDDEGLVALERPADWEWLSLKDALAAFPGTAASYMLPLFWQMEPPVFAACRAARMPLFTTQPDNLPVASASIRYAGVDTLIMEAPAAQTLQAHLTMYNDPAPARWLVVHNARTESWHHTPPKLSGVVFQEAHLAPGLPILVQCAHLARAGAQRFHRADPYAQNEVPFTLQPEGMCPCGKEVVSAHARL